MLGKKITDACGVEDYGTIRGIGLLPMETCFEEEKTRTRVEGKTNLLTGVFASLSQKKVSGYEIHMGSSKTESAGVILQKVSDISKSGLTEADTDMEKPDGCYSGNVMGTYLHGIFDGQEFRSAFTRLLCQRKGIDYCAGHTISYQEYKEEQFDKLAQVLRENLDMDAIYQAMGLR